AGQRRVRHGRELLLSQLPRGRTAPIELKRANCLPPRPALCSARLSARCPSGTTGGGDGAPGRGPPSPPPVLETRPTWNSLASDCGSGGPTSDATIGGGRRISGSATAWAAADVTSAAVGRKGLLTLEHPTMPSHRDRRLVGATGEEARSWQSSEEPRETGNHTDRVPGREVDAVGRLDRALAGLGEARRVPVPGLDLAAHARVVGELRLAPLGVGEVQELERQLEVTPAVAREEIEQVVALCRHRVALVRGPVRHIAAAQGYREAVVKIGGGAAVHEQRNGERHEAAVGEPSMAPAQVVVDEQPPQDLVPGLEVDAPAAARQRTGLISAGIAVENQLARQVQVPDGR